MWQYLCDMSFTVSLTNCFFNIRGKAHTVKSSWGYLLNFKVYEVFLHISKSEKFMGVIC